MFNKIGWAIVHPIFISRSRCVNEVQFLIS
nr:MAG TPA: hypothetical protein [Bacteriophage sp.]